MSQGADIIQVDAPTAKRSSGTVSSLSRQWSTTNPSSSQSQWTLQAGSTDWPASPPRKKSRPSNERSTDPIDLPLVTGRGNTIAKKASVVPKESRSKVQKPTNSQNFAPWFPELTRVGPKLKVSNGTTDKVILAKVEKIIKVDEVTGKPIRKSVPSIFLSAEQQHVLELVKKGESVFFTGSAGTGKSVLLRQIIKEIRLKHKSSDAVAVTASTGMAACNIGGTTIHSFAGIGLGIDKAEKLADNIRKNQKASGRWKRVKTLIMDEVSMLDGDLFDKLEYIGQNLRNSSKPFGGIQLVITGDFFQLPPVNKQQQPKFAFNAKTWNTALQHRINLTQVFRQTDTTFVDMLNEMRMGHLSQASISTFTKLSRTPTYNDGIVATELYALRDQVERSNSIRIANLKSESVVYVANDSGRGTEDQKRRDFANMMAVDKLILKKDAQVMMIKNATSEEGPNWLVNGLVGKVIDFIPAGMTIHEWHEVSQLQTNGESQRENIEWTVPGEGDDEPKSNLAKFKAGDAAGNSGVGESNPIVQWLLPDGKHQMTVVNRAEFKVENAEGLVMSRRVQMPLILAWAMSIHKSQGQTLARVKVDLSRVFEKGQSYVALSRAVSMEGLQVLGFHSSKVMAHPAVIKWSQDNLATFNQIKSTT